MKQVFQFLIKIEDSLKIAIVINALIFDNFIKAKSIL